MRFVPIAIVLLTLSCVAQTTGRVIGISDGDTIAVLSDKKPVTVRLAGIDAPEKGQDFSNTAKQFLSAAVNGKTVKLEGTKIDRYGRLVATVILDGQNVNLSLVNAGLAWHYKEYSAEQSAADRQLYATAETNARKAKLKIWSYANPVAPWDFRKGETPAFLAISNGRIIGNQNSKIYHAPGCPSYGKVAEQNRVYFDTKQKAEAAGYRAARNC